MKNKAKTKYQNSAYAYIMPAMIGFLVFTFYPFFQTIVRSLFITDRMGNSNLFVGLENYQTLFTNPSFYNSLLVTLIYVAIVVSLGVGLGFLAALLCQRAFPGLKFFSAAYSLPMAIASSGMALVFKVMLNRSIGVINTVFKSNVSWLEDPTMALISVSILTAWLNSGMNFLYLSAGLAGIDDSLYESASIDGANGFQKFWHITLPSLKPIMFFVIVTNFINAFQSFAQIKLLTMGGPGEATNVIVHDIYKNAFENYRYGYASAESIVLFFIVMLFTIVLFKKNGGGKSLAER
ncbi:MAG: sugar ABC transporter permease [Ezakiella sp.]|nr:sugar ABC transporter permease [Ezakiella sp.]MDD7761178.1 sugar ABC transporter permease [Bacillota bacterium]MDY3946849.1 sugar ABC transporter permease [Ezakiella sp.]